MTGRANIIEHGNIKRIVYPSKKPEQQTASRNNRQCQREWVKIEVTLNQYCYNEKKLETDIEEENDEEYDDDDDDDDDHDDDDTATDYASNRGG